jgi:hypothetical protein
MTPRVEHTMTWPNQDAASNPDSELEPAHSTVPRARPLPVRRSFSEGGSLFVRPLGRFSIYEVHLICPGAGNMRIAPGKRFGERHPG